MRTDSIDSNALRLYYLQQMGISVYVPRVTAEPEVNAEIAVAAETVLAPAQDTTPALPASTSQASQSRKNLLEGLDENPVPTAKEPMPIEETGIADEAATSASSEALLIPPFQLLFARLSAEVGVVVQIPAVGKAVLPAQDARLLLNILKWLRLDMPEQAWLGFRWPLPGFKQGSADAATASLQAFLQQAVSEQPLQHLLVLGLAPADCLKRNASTTSVARQCWYTHGLAELSAVPALKREAWLQLQPLHKALG